MAKRYEGSQQDEAEDAAGAKATGMSKKQYEKSPRDKREDRAGEKRMKKMPPPPPPAAAAPAPSQFGLATPSGGDDEMGGM